MGLEHNNHNPEQETVLQEAKNESLALKIQAVQEYFDKFKDNPEEQEAQIHKLGERMNTSRDVLIRDAGKIKEQCLNEVEKHGYNFQERPPSLVDLLDKFVKEQLTLGVKQWREECSGHPWSNGNWKEHILYPQ